MSAMGTGLRISKSCAWEVLCFELFGGNSLSEAKTNSAASGFFAKAEVFVRNSLATIHYGLIIPLKAKTIGLVANEEIGLEVYEKHKKLSSEIQKVQEAYKSYTAAQKVFAAAPTHPVAARIAARNCAVAKGDDLVKKYDALIKLAILQADEIGFSENRYITDVKGKLNEETLICNTVNMIRSKQGIETFLFPNYHMLPGRSISSIRDDLGFHYLKFVTEFASKVREASFKSGNSSTLDDTSDISITESSITGLSTIPELSEGLVLIEFYAELTKLQTPDSLAKAQDEVLEHFSKEIEALINRGSPIGIEDVQNIQFKGISLLSVIKNLGFQQVNDIITLKASLQEAENVISETEAKIQEKQQFIAKSISYDFAQVQDFFYRRSEEEAKFEAIPNDEAIFGNFATSYREARKKYNDLWQQKKITKSTPQAKAARIRAITDNEAAVTKTKEEIARLAEVINNEVLELGSKEKELQNFENEIEETAQKIASEIGSDRIKKVKTTSFRDKCAEEITSMQDEINLLQNSARRNREARLAQEGKLTELKKTVEDLILQGEQEDQTLHDLDASIVQINISTIGSLSGKEVVALARRLEIGQPNWMHDLSLHIIHAQIEETKLQELTEDLNRNQNQAKTVSDRIAVLNAAMFSDQARAEITDQLELNLVIAKKVTMAVGRKVVEKDAESWRQKAEQDTGPHLSKSVYADRVSALKIELDALEKMDGNTNDLNTLVSNGIGKLGPIGEARQPKESPNVMQVRDRDAENWGNMGIGEV